MPGLTETQFRSLCEEVDRDREQIYEFNPGASHAEALLWMVLGSLFSLLSLREDEMPVVTESTSSNYLEAICIVVNAHRDGNFDPRKILNDLIASIGKREEFAGSDGD